MKNEREGLPPELHADIDVFENETFEACINDQNIDILFRASTSIKNDGTKAMSDLAYRTVEYRLAKILVDLYNGAATPHDYAPSIQLQAENSVLREKVNQAIKALTRVVNREGTIYDRTQIAKECLKSITE